MRSEERQDNENVRAGHVGTCSYWVKHGRQEGKGLVQDYSISLPLYSFIRLIKSCSTRFDRFDRCQRTNDRPNERASGQKRRISVYFERMRLLQLPPSYSSYLQYHFRKPPPNPTYVFSTRRFSLPPNRANERTIGGKSTAQTGKTHTNKGGCTIL